MSDSAVAIIGAACRFPGGADTPENLWHVVANGIDATSDVPHERFDAAAMHNPDPEARSGIATRRGGFLMNDIWAFDPGFFDLPTGLAEALDPQMRLLLELGYEAVEDAGLDLHRIGEDGGIYAGMAFTEYRERMLARPGGRPVDGHLICENNTCSAAGRLSFHFGFDGPSLSLNSACSSSLLAVHLACRDIVAGEAEIALAGGVNLLLEPDSFEGFSRLRVLAPDGRCKAFSADADGYGRAEGGGMIVLKPLARAQKDHDRILAVVGGTGVTNDGAATGYLEPNPDAQVKAARKAMARAGVGPDDIDMVEAHGTGTKRGDRTEVDALTRVFGGRDTNLPPIAMGAVKANIGHTEAAAGVASIIKAAMVLQRGILPPQPLYNKLNPAIDWPPFLKVPEGSEILPDTDAPRHVSINSFGMSGVNVNAILRSAPDVKPPKRGWKGPITLTLSARSPAALSGLARAWQTRLDGASEDAARRLAATAAWRRTTMRFRVTVSALTVAELRRELDLRAAQVAGHAPWDARQTPDIGLLCVVTPVDTPVFDAIAKDVPECAAALKALGRGAGSDAVLRGAAVTLGLAEVFRQQGVKAEAFGNALNGQVLADCVNGNLPPANLQAALRDCTENVDLPEIARDVVVTLGAEPGNPERRERDADLLTWRIPAFAGRGATATDRLWKTRILLHDLGVTLEPSALAPRPGPGWLQAPRYVWDRQHLQIGSAAPPVPQAVVAVPAAEPAPDAAAQPRTGVRVGLPQVRQVVADLLGRPVDQVDPDRAFVDLGVDSLMAPSLSRALADLGVEVGPAAIWTWPTIRGLAEHVAGLGVKPVSPPAPLSERITQQEAALDALLERLDT